MVTEPGAAFPERPPDHPLNVYPEFAVAWTDTLSPLLYQFMPEGFTVPPSAGAAEVVSAYWVVKLAVQVVLEEGTMMVWVRLPPLLHWE